MPFAACFTNTNIEPILLRYITGSSSVLRKSLDGEDAKETDRVGMVRIQIVIEVCAATAKNTPYSYLHLTYITYDSLCILCL